MHEEVECGLQHVDHMAKVVIGHKVVVCSTASHKKADQLVWLIRSSAPGSHGCSQDKEGENEVESAGGSAADLSNKLTCRHPPFFEVRHTECMLEHHHSCDHQFVVGVEMRREMPLADCVGDLGLAVGGDCYVCAAELLIVRPQAAYPLHEARDHGLAEIGKRLLLIDTNPRPLTPALNFQERLLLLGQIVMSTVGASLEGGDAPGTQRADNYVGGTKLQTFSYKGAIGGEAG